MKRKLNWYYGLFLAVAMLQVACSIKAPQSASGSAPMPAPKAQTNLIQIASDSPHLAQLRVEEVKLETIPAGEVTAPGKIEANPNRIARVSLPVAGKVTQMLARLGDSVAAGQPLLTMESPEADEAQAAYLQSLASLTQAQAGLTQANSALARANTAARKAQTDLDRTRDLFEHEAIAQKEVLNAETDLKQAQAEVEVAQAAVEQAQAAIEQARAVREQAQRRLTVLGLKPGEAKSHLVLRAPLAGKVLELGIVAGEYRNDTAAPVMTIADLRSVWVSSDVPENMIRLVAVGEAVNITLDAYPERTFSGRVARLADTLDPKTRTLKVMIDLPNAQDLLRPEMFGRIRHLEPAKPTPALPVEAVIQGEGRNIVYVEQSKSRFELREVTLGYRFGNRVAILSGVTPGERIVVDGAMLLKNRGTA